MWGWGSPSGCRTAKPASRWRAGLSWSYMRCESMARFTAAIRRHPRRMQVSALSQSGAISKPRHRGELGRSLMIPTSLSISIWVLNGFESFCRRSRIAFACGAGASRGMPRLANLSE